VRAILDWATQHLVEEIEHRARRIGQQLADACERFRFSA
jgi:hypothetical protein